MDEEERGAGVSTSHGCHIKQRGDSCVFDTVTRGAALVFDSPTTLLLSGNTMN